MSRPRNQKSHEARNVVRGIRLEELAENLSNLERIEVPSEADLWEMAAVREDMELLEQSDYIPDPGGA